MRRPDSCGGFHSELVSQESKRGGWRNCWEPSRWERRCRRFVSRVTPVAKGDAASAHELITSLRQRAGTCVRSVMWELWLSRVAVMLLLSASRAWTLPDDGFKVLWRRLIFEELLPDVSGRYLRKPVTMSSLDLMMFACYRTTCCFIGTASPGNGISLDGSLLSDNTLTC